MSEIWNEDVGWWDWPPQGITTWLATFDEAYQGARGRRPERNQAYMAARRAQVASELPLSVQEVRRVIETAWVLSSGRLLE